MGNYELEAKIQALTSGDAFEKKDNTLTTRMVRAPIQMAMNTIRFAMGKQIISTKEENKTVKVLEIAYFWERNRKYSEAIQMYGEVLQKHDLSPDVRSSVMIHKAFCHSMHSEYAASRRIYEDVINQYPNTEAGILSWKLIDFVETVEKERDKVEGQSVSFFEKAKQFYMLMDYRNAIRDFSVFLTGGPSKDLVPEARFFKGRSHEELGENDEAMAEYQEVIATDRTQRWAKQANRRLLMLGEFYETKQQVSEEARKRLDAYQDMVFADKVQQYATMVTESSLRGELLSQLEKKTDKRDKSTDSLLAFINSIGELDLTGEKARQQQEQIESIKQELIAAGKLTAVQVKELERKSALAQNPYRRPSAIKNVIDENSQEVKYVYNRKLRQGQKLSGKMLVRLQIQPNGQIASASIVQSNMGDNSFEQEVLKTVGNWRFKPVPDSLGEMVVNYPFEFYKED